MHELFVAGDVEFTLSADFDPVPLGADWLRLMTEIYEKNLIPRTAWIALLKGNDLLPHDYDDEKGREEMQNDELTSPTNPQSLAGGSYANNVMSLLKAQKAQEAAAGGATNPNPVPAKAVA